MSYLSAIAENVRSLGNRPKNENRHVNPLKLLSSLSLTQWALFFSGFYAWTMDAYDFFSVSLTVSRLAAQFDKKTTDITQSITLTLLFRSLGAAIFGLISDRYGRKWPLVINLVIVAALEVGTGFVHNFHVFLAVRSLFGIGMGGIWGLASANGLENMPVEARGMFSGILQEGYAVGYLIAACVNLSVVPHYDTWRPLFFIGAGLSLGAAFVRALLPESEFFMKQKEAGKTGHKGKVFFKQIGAALKLHWVRCVYAVLLMTGFNFFSHGSQDLFPTYIQVAKGLSSYQATVATIIGNCGAVVGGIISGYMSQYFGRRLVIIVCCIWTACWIPLWIVPNSFGALSAGAFFVQTGVQGAWGVIPIYLQEISPPAFRAVFPGLAYQMGNMVSSASAQIEATAGEHLKTTVKGKVVPDYGKIQGILIGVVAAWIIFWTAVGSEYHGSHFEDAKTADQEGAGRDEGVIEEYDESRGSQRSPDLETSNEKNDGKEEGEFVERA